MKKLRIAQIVGDSSMTGAPRHVLLLSHELQKRGHNILVIAPSGIVINQFKKHKINTAQVKMGSPFDRKADHRIREILRQFRPQIVHCHGTKGGWLGRLAARKIKNIKVIYTEHLWTPDYKLKNPVWHQFQLRGLKYMDRFTDVTIAVSKTVAKFLKSRGVTKKSKLTVIPNILDDRFLHKKRYEKPEEVPQIIGAVGSLNEQKGYLYLLEALAILVRKKLKCNWRSQIIGSGPMEKIIKRKIKKLKLHRKVDLIMRVDDILESMRHFTYYVQYSRTESFGMAVMEVMALGVPPIVSDRGALPEIIKNERDGLVVSYGKPSALANALERLINDKALWRKLSDNGLRVAQKYSGQKVVGEIEKVYRDVLGKN